jgi:hypothetical protein
MSNCLTCGIKTTDLYKHHIVPVSRGGLEYEGNLILVCGTCHGKIHGKLDMSYLTAFEKRHGFSFIDFIAEFDSCESDEEICERIDINQALLTTLKRAAGIIPSGCIKRYTLEQDAYGGLRGSWNYVEW